MMLFDDKGLKLCFKYNYFEVVFYFVLINITIFLYFLEKFMLFVFVV